MLTCKEVKFASYLESSKLLTLDRFRLPRYEIRLLKETLFCFFNVSTRYATTVTVVLEDACIGSTNDIDRPSMFAAVRACQITDIHLRMA